MDKKSIRINFNFNIAKNKNGRNNSHFKTKHYKKYSSTNISRVCKNNSKVSIPRYLCKNIALCMKMILIELLMNKLWLTLEMLLKNYLLKKVVM